MNTNLNTLPIVKKLTVLTVAQFRKASPAKRAEAIEHATRQAAVGFTSQLVGAAQGFSSLRWLMVTAQRSRKDAVAAITAAMPDGLKSSSLGAYSLAIAKILADGDKVPETAKECLLAAKGRGKTANKGRKPRAGGQAQPTAGEGGEGEKAKPTVGRCAWQVLGLPLEAVSVDSPVAGAPREVTLSSLLEGLRKFGYAVERIRPTVSGHAEYESWFPRVAAARAARAAKEKIAA